MEGPKIGRLNDSEFDSELNRIIGVEPKSPNEPKRPERCANADVSKRESLIQDQLSASPKSSISSYPRSKNRSTAYMFHSWFYS